MGGFVELLASPAAYPPMDDIVPKQAGLPARQPLASQDVDRWLTIRLREGYDAVLHERPPEAMLALLRDGGSESA